MKAGDRVRYVGTAYPQCRSWNLVVEGVGRFVSAHVPGAEDCISAPASDFELALIAKLPPPSDGVMEALRALSDDWHAIVDETLTPPKPIPAPRHSATCPYCFGPATPEYVGLFSREPLRCERVGGCLADVTPSVRTYGMDRNRRSWLTVHTPNDMPPREQVFRAVYLDDEGPLCPTPDLAIAAWREQVIARAKAGAR